MVDLIRSIFSAAFMKKKLLLFIFLFCDLVVEKRLVKDQTELIM